MLEKIIYADNAATTPLSEQVMEAMSPFYRECFANPSSIHSLGGVSRDAVEKAREEVASLLGAQYPTEIYFTSGGTESDNWAIKGVARVLLKKGKNHIITSKFEHHAVLHTVKALEKEGFSVTYLDVYKNGIVNPKDLEEAITEKTALVSIMYANNEIGTIQPINELGKICKGRKVLFHTDAVQAAGHIPLNVTRDNVDLLSLSAHKFHGPKGVGVLYAKRGTAINNLLEGGAQERAKRAGTENVAGIVGLSVALREACENLDENYKKVKELRDYLEDNLLKIEGSVLNGDKIGRLPGTTNISFAGIEGESLLLLLDELGICASSGSACTSRSLEPSHVLLAIGLKHEIAHGSLRITLSEENTLEDVKTIALAVPKIVKQLREMSPLWEEMRKSRVCA